MNRRGRHGRARAVWNVGAVGLLAASAVLSGCGGDDPLPADDEFSGNTGENADSGANAGSNANADSGANAGAESGADAADSADSVDSTDSDAGSSDTGTYQDGDYKVEGEYGPIGEDAIDVYITVEDGDVASVNVVGHYTTRISKGHQEAFIEAIPGVVVGQPLKDLNVDTVAGASWTSEAFNDALDLIREQASAVQ